MPQPQLRNGAAFGSIPLWVSAWVCAFQKPFEHNILIIIVGNFTHFWPAQMYLGSQICCLDLLVKRSKVKVTAGNDPKTLWTPNLTNQWREFCPFLVTSVLGFTDVQISFLNQRSKVKVTAGNYPKKPSEYIIFVAIFTNTGMIGSCMYLHLRHTASVQGQLSRSQEVVMSCLLYTSPSPRD